MDVTIPTDVIVKIAREQSAPEDIIRAIIRVESNSNPCAVRAEPMYRFLWDVEKNTPFRSIGSIERNQFAAPADFPSAAGSQHTEWVGQRSSWGPMQIMGAVARELGFRGFFPELCNATGIVYGVKHFMALHHRFFANHGITGVVAAYNAGSPRYVKSEFVNQSYVDKVASFVPGGLK